MAETIKLKTTELYKYRWVLITWGIFLLVFGLLGIYLWPIIVSFQRKVDRFKVCRKMFLPSH
jgi:hypothetical protein